VAEENDHVEIVKYLLFKGADPSGLKKRYPVDNQNVQKTNQVNSSQTIELKVKDETLIRENKKDWDQSQNEWIKEEVWKKENLALEQQRNEAIKQRDEAIKQRDEAIKQKGEAIEQKGEAIKQKGEAIKRRDEAIKQRDAASAKYEAVIQKMQTTNSLNETTIQDLVKKIEQLQVQQTKVASSSSLEFRELLVDIAEELTEKEWKSMHQRFEIPKNMLPDSAINFFRWLVDTKEISSVDLSRREKLLNQHHRPQVVERFIIPYRLRNANK